MAWGDSAPWYDVGPDTSSANDSVDTSADIHTTDTTPAVGGLIPKRSVKSSFAVAYELSNMVFTLSFASILFIYSSILFCFILILYRYLIFCACMYLPVTQMQRRASTTCGADYSVHDALQLAISEREKKIARHKRRRACG